MIYIIGANGFVGSAFVDYCERNKIDYKPVTRETYETLVGTSCDVLVNANGNSKKFLANRDPKLDFQLSVESVLKSTQDFRFDKYLHLSTCDVYENTSSAELNSEDVSIDIGKLSHYGANKYLAEQIVRHYCRDWTIFRLGGMIGPNLKKNPIFDLLWGDKLFVHPESQMQFLHTDRVAEIALSQHGNLRRRILNLVASEPISIREIAKLVPEPFAKNLDSKLAQSSQEVGRYEISSESLVALCVKGIETKSNLQRYFAEINS